MGWVNYEYKAILTSESTLPAEDQQLGLMAKVVLRGQQLKTVSTI